MTAQGLTRAQRDLLAAMPDESVGRLGLLVWGAKLKTASALVERGLARRVADNPPSNSGYYVRLRGAA